MSLYDTYVLPRVLDMACGIAALDPERERLVARAHGKVLEIGFGSGLNLPFLPAGIERVLAVDPSGPARKLGAKRIQASSCPVDFVGLDAARIQVADCAADCALSTFTLCSIEDVRAALGEVRRIVKPGGSFLFLEHGRAPDEGARRWQDRLNPLQRCLCGGCNLNRDIAGLIEAAGFRVRSLNRRYLPGTPKAYGYLYSGIAEV